MKTIYLVSLALLISACATTYQAPTSAAPDTSMAIPADEQTLLSAAKQVLVMEGYQITNADESAGVISTGQKDMRLSPELANCGTTMGLDYLKDNRTSSKIGFGVIVSAGKVTLKANISATYLPGSDTQSITLTCVSTGVIEGGLLTKIASTALGN